jgi:hypothetical protein
MARREASSLFFLQLALGIFFIVLGVLAIVQDSTILNEAPRVDRFANAIARFFGSSRSDVLEIVVAILVIAAGVVVFADLFFPVEGRLYFIAALFLFIFWLTQFILILFINGFPTGSSFMPWLMKVCSDTVFLASTWIISGRYK